MGMRIQIVYPTDGWILNKLGKLLSDRVPDAVGSPDQPDRNAPFDITYFINYYLYKPQRCYSNPFGKLRNSRILGGFFTHRQGKHFDRRARQMDFCICPCRTSFEHALKQNKRSFLVYHGIDLERYVPKLRLGFVGRFSPDGRKGEDLFHVLDQLDFVDLIVTNGTISEEQMPAFYQTLDYVFIPSKNEGGPLCFQEGLASGKEIISTEVGMVRDFKTCEGVHTFNRDSPEELKQLLHGLYDKKTRLRRAVENYSWEYFVSEHLKIFRSLAQT